MTGLEHVRFADEELIKPKSLKGEAAQTIIRGRIVLSIRWKMETGEGVITRYPVFPELNCSMTIFICPAGWRTERTHGPICWRSITAGQGDLSVSFRMEGLSIWGKAIWQSMS